MTPMRERAAKVEKALLRLLEANRALGRIVDGKTLYEGSPTKSQECYEAWRELNDAGAEARHSLNPSMKLHFTDAWLREKIMQVPDGVETEAGEPIEGRILPDDPNPTRAALEECAASLLETMAEAKEHLRNIVEAKAEDFRGLDDPRLKTAYDQETARMEAIVRRAEHAYATARNALQETEK